MASTTDDKRLTAVLNEEKTAINNANKTYDNMINQTDSKYNELINANKDYATKQQEIQQQNTNFAIEQINQQKEKAEKDYTKEQTGAYTDYQKATNQYGVQAEQQAMSGLQNSGFAESSKVQAFTSYQNRYSTAREVYNNAILSYDNAIKDAQLKNNAQLAEIAYQSLQTQLQYALEGFQYKNTLLQTKLNTQIQLDSEYNNRYQQVLSQINTENSLAEQIRQYNESMAYQKQRDAVQDAQWEKQYALSKASVSGSGGGGVQSDIKNGGDNNQSSNNQKGIVTDKKSEKPKINNTSNNKTSKAYTSAYNTLKNMQNNRKGISGALNKNALRDTLAMIYKSGKLTDSEFKKLANEFGL